MEGPAFSTKAESNLYRIWGMDVIGMTNLQEAKLAREAEICYATVAMVTDYDCWHPEHDAVTVADIIRNLTKNAENAAKVVAAAVRLLAAGAETMRLLDRAGARADHGQEDRAGRDLQEAGADRWKVFRRVNCAVELLNHCLRGSRWPERPADRCRGGSRRRRTPGRAGDARLVLHRGGAAGRSVRAAPLRHVRATCSRR